MRVQRERLGAPSLEALAATLVANAATEAAGAAAKSAKAIDAAPIWPKDPKRERPASPEPRLSTARPPDRPQSAAPELPSGWGDRVSTLTEGAFGAHNWNPTKPEGVDEQIRGAPPREAAAAPTPVTAAPSIPPPTQSTFTPGIREVPPAMQSTPPPQAVAAPPATALPPAAKAIAPAIQSVLTMMTARVGACSAAVGGGDAAAAAAAAEISNIWAQAQRALKQYESAMENAADPLQTLLPASKDPPRLAPRPEGMLSDAGDGAPPGFGDRQTAVSEADLVRRGVIMHQAPLSESR